MRRWDFFDLYLKAFPHHADYNRLECHSRDGHSDADDSFIDSELQTWLYDQMHLEKNGQKRTTRDVRSVFMGLPMFTSIEGISPATGIRLGARDSGRRQARVVGDVGGNPLNMKKMEAKHVGKKIEGMKNTVMGGGQQLGSFRFWSSAAAAAAAVARARGSAP